MVRGSIENRFSGLVSHLNWFAFFVASQSEPKKKKKKNSVKKLGKRVVPPVAFHLAAADLSIENVGTDWK